MTDEEIDKLEAGREMDRVVAENVMGIKRTVHPEHDWERNEDGSIDNCAMDADTHNGPMCKRCAYSYCVHCWERREKAGRKHDECVTGEPLPYSKQLTFAWEVHEKMLESDRCNLYCGFIDVDGLNCDAAEASRRICRAALKAVGR